MNAHHENKKNNAYVILYSFLEEDAKEQKVSSRESVSEITPPVITSTASTKEVDQGKSVIPFNAQKYQIPWELMSDDLMKKLNANERPEPKVRNHMIRVIADDIHKRIKKPGRKVLNVIAERICEKYPRSFTDEIGMSLNATSHFSLLSQLEVRFNNLNRSNIVHVLKRQSKNEDSSSKRVKSSDSYGCINYQPLDLPNGETAQSQTEKKEQMKNLFHSGFHTALNEECRNLLKLTYCTIRKDINTRKALDFLLTEWPLLFVKEGFLDHFNELVGINILESMSSSILKIGTTIISYFLSEPKMKTSIKEKMRGVISELKSNTSEKEELYSWEVLIALLMTYLEEEIGMLFIIVEVSILYLMNYIMISCKLLLIQDSI